jgi:hypothetical protein
MTITMKQTGLDQAVSFHFHTAEESPQHPPGWKDDERWRLVQKVVDSPQFSKSPRLSQFLLYIVARTLEGRQSALTEQQIGVHVFGRPHGYRTVDDNIVRSYARQLRKRLAEYFGGDGVGHAMRIEIPLGGYLPEFIALAPQNPDLAIPPQAPAPAARARRRWPRSIVGICALFIYSVAIICLTWIVQARMIGRQSSPQPAHLLWKATLQGPGDTFIVPPDAGLNLVEDLSHQQLPLADYLRSDYLDRSLPGVDPHSDSDLRSQQFSDFTSLQLVAMLARLPEYNPARVLLRFPRDLRFDDLKRSNAVIIGSSCSNPWAVIADSMLNFRVQCDAGMRGATIVNLKPREGESASYSSQWNEPVHETYAVISFIPDLSGYGNLLLLGGLDAAATQAAGEALIRSDAITSILERARRPDGSLAPFEVLLRSTSIQASATDTKVIASRIRL